MFLRQVWANKKKPARPGDQVFQRQVWASTGLPQELPCAATSLAL
jgi:hypothetical protein